MSVAIGFNAAFDLGEFLIGQQLGPPTQVKGRLCLVGRQFERHHGEKLPTSIRAVKCTKTSCLQGVRRRYGIEHKHNQKHVIFMGKRDPRIDAYIAKSTEFARPILKHLRELVHQGCPEVEETIKWSMPSFEYKGLLCGMAGFNQHVTFHFWKDELVVGKEGSEGAMGQFGRITKPQDLPADKVLLDYIRKAVELNEAGIKAPSHSRASPGEKRQLVIPDFLVAALKKNKQAQTNFGNFSFSHKKEYVEWLTGAKREETRQKRLETALAWIAEGKPQNWKYMRC